MEPVHCFEVGAALIEKGRGEHSLRQLFVAENEVEAVKAAVAWGEERGRALGWFLGCIKVWHYLIHPPEPSGYIKTGAVPFYLFEWKCDWPGSLTQYVAAFEVNAKRLKEKKTC
jgi:hypothetical protein